MATAGLIALLNADRLLLAFTLPIILIFIGQAFLLRAHANWAAGGYIAATVLVTATMLRDGRTAGLQNIALSACGFRAVIIAIAPAFARGGNHEQPAASTRSAA